MFCFVISLAGKYPAKNVAQIKTKILINVDSKLTAKIPFENGKSIGFLSKNGTRNLKSINEPIAVPLTE